MTVKIVMVRSNSRERGNDLSSPYEPTFRSSWSDSRMYSSAGKQIPYLAPPCDTESVHSHPLLQRPIGRQAKTHKSLVTHSLSQSNTVDVLIMHSVRSSDAV